MKTHKVTIETIIRELQKLPKDTEITGGELAFNLSSSTIRAFVKDESLYIL